MEHYDKGEVVEVEGDPGIALSEEVVQMKVNQGSKIRNLMGYAMKKFKEPTIKQLAWVGSGAALTKAVSCAEIMKRKIKGLHQNTKIHKKRIEEYWEPKMEGLERLKVKRDIPAVTILLSKDPLDTSEPGYQAPGSIDSFLNEAVKKGSRPQRDHPRSKSHSSSAGGSNRDNNPPPVGRKRKKAGRDGPKDKGQKEEKDKSNKSESASRKMSDTQGQFKANDRGTKDLEKEQSPGKCDKNRSTGSVKQSVVTDTDPMDTRNT